MKNKKDTSVTELENEIESGLVTAHEYANPEIFLPLNPIFRLLKKAILRAISPYTKYQIVFNHNLLHSINKMYQHLLKQDAEKEDLKGKVELLENKLKKIEENGKKR